MHISLHNIAKKYENNVIFKKLSYEFNSPGIYYILGENGSGKSTLVKIIAGIESPIRGKVTYSQNSTKIPAEHIYKYLGLSAPYIDPPQHLYLKEIVALHRKNKSFIDGLSDAEVIDIINIKNSDETIYQKLSSGQKQKIRLCLSVLSDTTILIIDEPTANLDIDNATWARELIKKYSEDRIVIWSTNEPADILSDQNQLNLIDYK